MDKLGPALHQNPPASGAFDARVRPAPKPRRSGHDRILESMVAPWKDSELDAFHERWQRRGELLVSISVTSAFVWLAAVLPTVHATHVNIWPPIGIALAMLAVGIWVIVAAETGKLWLPGRQGIRRTALGRAMTEMHERFERSEPVTVQLLQDDKPVPFSPPLEYQTEMLRQVIPLLSDIGFTEMDLSGLTNAFALAERQDKNPLLEPLRGEACRAGLARFAEEGVIEMIDEAHFRITS